MRLKQIKLSGFKSFVDPTAFEVPGQRVGVVGPNGCGKSNIIDAVRWVLGESKASELRGESMQDVIFSGSADRKPASRASVELVFDNSLGRIGGAWSSFAELAVKRVLSRDNQSAYYINNQPVRRKDVHDLFLGTGLGPRAYAIIGQGSISRIIEARPEDLRVFLEEAAGISRYKERRRETENRLADTRENLTRVEDIRRELDAQIDKLSRQAEVARQYREFEADRERKQQMLWLVRRDEARAEQQRLAQDAGRAQIAVDGALAELRELEAALEGLRGSHYAASDEVHAAQAAHYTANAEVVRLETEIRRVVDTQEEIGGRLSGLQARQTRARQDCERALEEQDEARGALEEAQARAEDLTGQLYELTEATTPLEQQVREARARLEQARAVAISTRQAIELCAERQRNAQRALADAQRRQERLQGERAQVESPPEEDLAAVREALAIAEEAEQRGLQAQSEAETRWREAEQARAPAQQALRDAEGEFTRVEARIVALKQLQERAQSQSRIGPWLSRHGLDSLGRLWQRLRIEEGWETAVESVIRERVEALEIGRLQTAAALVADAPPAKVAFLSPRVQPVVAAPLAGLRPLIEVIRVTDAGLHAVLADWLHGHWAAESLDAAVARSAELLAGQRLVTREGHVVGPQSLQLYAADSAQEGVLARQQDLEHLAREQRARQLLADEARAATGRIEKQAAEAGRVLGQARDAHSRAVRDLATARLDAQRLEQLHERARLTRGRLEQDLSEVAGLIEEALATVEEQSAAFEQLDADLAEHQQVQEDAAQAFEGIEAQLAAHRERVRAAERAEQEADFARREAQARIERLEARIAQARQQEQESREEAAALEGRLASLSDAETREALDAALAARAGTEQSLSAARQRLDDITQTLRGRDEERLTLERRQEPLRQRLVEAQMREQAARLSVEQYATLIAEKPFDESAVRAHFPQEPRASWLQGEVTRLDNAITGLGAVNLAALEELGASQERKKFLDDQSADLTEAINTLEDAIRRIDRETRELLQQTYDAVNRGFGQLFPELFGGGEARLILTGAELLDAGIQVMAQPPGKRNTTIHLLSGGEKALTAIALVFAMFQLNPAPFCLLDEVDAPLDDANTERYCEMVRRMSDQTQFLFITHNKIAMELAQQLVGVTMQERGVSRIVAVDIDSARQMAQAA
ncbi:MAG: chromosome segregation protein SMC [Betaproteobacteria bacterium]|nr:chromosome segregation protein SMC [Betaproteobacteria bacterium]